MSKRIRLSEKEAEMLGLTVKEKVGEGNPQYRVNDSQLQKLDDYRGLEGVKIEADKAGIDLNDVKHGWLKTEGASFFFHNPMYNTKSLEEFKENLLDLISKRAPKYKYIKRTEINVKPVLLIVNPADIHLGKLCTAFQTGDEYNINIAEQQVYEGVKGLIKASSGHNIEQIVFIGGNDVLHVDNTRRTTTNGTPQDTDGMWYDAYLRATEMYINVLEMLLPIADVHFIYCPSNHDKQSGFHLCQSVRQYFRRNENITFDVSMKHRKYYRYGNSLLGFTHGDGGKIQDLPLTMAHEASILWGQVQHRYIFVHHVHHKTSKDYQGVNVETMRSPSGTDAWHHDNQYCNNIKAIEAFIIHKQYGKIAQYNHIYQ